MRPTKEERQARAIAKRLVNALGEFENFFGDPEMIVDEALQVEPKMQVSAAQLAEIRNIVGRLLETSICQQ